jgi:hypothetical protein
MLRHFFRQAAPIFATVMLKVTLVAQFPTCHMAWTVAIVLAVTVFRSLLHQRNTTTLQNYHHRLQYVYGILSQQGQWYLEISEQGLLSFFF